MGHRCRRCMRQGFTRPRVDAVAGRSGHRPGPRPSNRDSPVHSASLSAEGLPLYTQGDPVARLHICIAYDRLYPWSIGGAERWYRGLAELLAKAGHQVTYLTMRQWPTGEEPTVPGVRVVAIADDGALYTRSRRRLAPLLRFGLALGWHL